MEDSGIDSDSKSNQKSSLKSQSPVLTTALTSSSDALQTDDEKLIVRKASEFQRKIDKQRVKNRRKQAVDTQPRRAFLGRNRLNIPGKQDLMPFSQDQQPLVAIVSDDSEDDEFAVPRLTKEAQREITEQLIKDGYNLDLEPDDEDLDLIPPRPLHERCSWCPSLVLPRCSVQ